MTDRSYDVIVLGAGAAGLTAARRLVQSGKSVLVVEARNRVGGRIFSRSIDGEIVELGAEFVHGKPPLLWKLIEEASLETYESAGRHFCWEQNVLRECGAEFGRDFAWLEALKNWDREDCTFAEYLETAQVPTAARKRLIGYVEGFNAADHRVIGVAALGKQQAIEDATQGDRLFHIRGGYAQVPQFLAAEIERQGGTIRLQTRAEQVRWKHGTVEIDCIQNGEAIVVRAAAAVIALPLALLQTDHLRFSPAPAHMKSALLQIKIGHARRLVLLLRQPFWQNLSTIHDHRRELGFLHSPTATFPIWWTQFPEASRGLTGWAGGPRADRLAGKPPQLLQQESEIELAKIFDWSVDSLQNLILNAESHDWQRDPLAMGSYSYLPAGALHAPDSLSEPVERTLFFAGEHTDTTGNWGTVHGAMESGVRAANQVLEQ